MTQQYNQGTSLEQMNLGMVARPNQGPQLMNRERVQQSSTQIMKKKPYFNNAAAAQ